MAVKSSPVYIDMEDRGNNVIPNLMADHEPDTHFGTPESFDDDPFQEDPNSLLSAEDIWGERQRRRSELKKSTSFKFKGRKEITRYVKCTGSLHTALLKITSETDSTVFPEGKIGLYVAGLIQKGAKVSTTDSEGNTPLHLAAMRGYSEVAQELLRWGANPHAENKQHKTPLEIAIHHALEGFQENVGDYNDFATLMIREMDAPIVRGMFLSEKGNLPKLNFHILLDNEDMMDTVNAVMDKLIEQVPGHKRTYNVYYDLLEANENGIVVKNPSKISHRRRLGKSALDRIAWTANKEAVSHVVVRLLLLSKWRRYARVNLILHFVYWMITMTAITVSLVLAASEPDPQNYNHPLDSFRVVCEAVAVFMVILASIKELYHIYVWRFSYFLEYSFFAFNYFNLATMIFMAIVIPLRALGFNEQWIFASFLYMCYGARVIQYISSITFLGTYIHIVYLIIKRDLMPFMCVLAILLFIFAGGFYFALREEVITPTLITPQCNFSSVESALSTFNLTVSEVEEAVNTSSITFMTSLDINHDETGTYPRVFFTGIRTVVEGNSVLTSYFGSKGGFGWLGVTTYMIFLFFVEVVLLNLLIAQMSDTFSNVQGDAQRSLAINQARTIISIEKTGLFLNFKKCMTIFYKSEEKWTNPQKHVEKLDSASITNIYNIVLRSRKLINQNVISHNDMKETMDERDLVTNEKLDLILKKLAELQK